ncbi:MAG: leucine-rich repeat domain-containing protein, partial [Clostridium sp.]
SSVVVPEKYKELDIISVSYDLFKDNYNVQHIFISDKINEIEISASENKLKSIEVSNNNPKYASKDGVLYTKDFSNLLIYPLKKENTDFTIQKETTSYDSKETFPNKYLKNIYVEDGNKKFSSYDGAVYNYDKTKLLTIPEGKESITVSGGVELDNAIFAFKTNLKIVKLNNGIKKIPSYAFNGCTSLKDIYIPNTVTEIDSYAFEKVDLNNLTIYAEENTYAEKYANENKIKFVNLTQKNRQAVLNKINTLNSLIEKFDKIDSNKYTEDSMLNLKSTIMSARNLVKKSNLTEKQVDEEIDKLYTAVKTLKEI